MVKKSITLGVLWCGMVSISFAQNRSKDEVEKSTFIVFESSKKTWNSGNLNVEVFRNGDKIPQAQSDEAWQEAGFNEQPAWCYFPLEKGRPDKGMGKLYNRFAVMDPRGLAPEGWHIATREEWEGLEKEVASAGIPIQSFLLDPGNERKENSSLFPLSLSCWGWRDVGFGGWGNSVTYWISPETTVAQAGESSVPTVSFAKGEDDYYSTFEWGSTSWIMGHYVRCVMD